MAQCCSSSLIPRWRGRSDPEIPTTCGPNWLISAIRISASGTIRGGAMGQLDISEALSAAASLEPRPVHLGYHFWDVGSGFDPMTSPAEPPWISCYRKPSPCWVPDAKRLAVGLLS